VESKPNWASEWDKDKIHLEVKDLRIYFFTRWGTVKAVNGVNFVLKKGETLGLVGESGCGKSTTCLAILRLVPEPACRIVGGQILLQGEDLLTKSKNEMRRIRGSKISMILQDPMTSLNPVLTIGNQLTEAIKLHAGLHGKSIRERAREMLERVYISSPESRLRNYPHELSGGMRQRVVGAIALSCEPHLLIADEPTTSLDATIQAQYLRLLRELQEQFRLTMIFVTHDFGIVARMCRRVAVMYAGRILETADVRELFNRPLHPYTELLMKSVPKVEERVERLAGIEGQPPSLHDLPAGCTFAPRCPFVEDRCRLGEHPSAVEVTEGHLVSCWKYS
jgi:oligopeptide/dipeptide ABC transporter ATP-binding protein